MRAFRRCLKDYSMVEREIVVSDVVCRKFRSEGFCGVFGAQERVRLRPQEVKSSSKHSQWVMLLFPYHSPTHHWLEEWAVSGMVSTWYFVNSLLDLSEWDRGYCTQVSELAVRQIKCSASQGTHPFILKIARDAAQFELTMSSVARRVRQTRTRYSKIKTHQKGWNAWYKEDERDMRTSCRRGIGDLKGRRKRLKGMKFVSLMIQSTMVEPMRWPEKSFIPKDSSVKITRSWNKTT